MQKNVPENKRLKNRRRQTKEIKRVARESLNAHATERPRICRECMTGSLGADRVCDVCSFVEPAEEIVAVIVPKPGARGRRKGSRTQEASIVATGRKRKASSISSTEQGANTDQTPETGKNTAVATVAVASAVASAAASGPGAVEGKAPFALQERLEVHTCRTCKHSLNSAMALEVHRQQKHPKRKRRVAGAQEHYCTQEGCNYSSKRRSNMDRHMKQHEAKRTGVKGFKCTFAGCEYSSATKGNLALHSQRHTQSFPCTMCSYKATYKGSLTRHMLIHTRHKSIPCDFCTMTFYRQDHLKEHIRTHLGEHLEVKKLRLK
jgi:hypothetical protein